MLNNYFKLYSTRLSKPIGYRLNMFCSFVPVWVKKIYINYTFGYCSTTILPRPDPLGALSSWYPTATAAPGVPAAPRGALIRPVPGPVGRVKFKQPQHQPDRE